MAPPPAVSPRRSAARSLPARIGRRLPTAISRNAYGTAVWKSTDDGETWTDETGDLVTISPGNGVWYDTDFYLVSSGEGITVKRDFEDSELE